MERYFRTWATWLRPSRLRPAAISGRQYVREPVRDRLGREYDPAIPKPVTSIDSKSGGTVMELLAGWARRLKGLLPLPVRRQVRRLWEPNYFWDAMRTLRLSDAMPPSEHYKRRVLAHSGRGLASFVETGTFRGDTVEAMRRRFSAIWSIELGHDLALAAQRRFARWPHIEIIEGDSAAVLPTVLPRIEGPALFWLDGHWNGDELTAPGHHPLMDELRAVLARGERDVILVDDVRMFGTGDYPSLEMVAALVARASPPRKVSVIDDIMHVVV